VVATRVGGNPEAVEDGATGLLVPPRDARALESAIARLLEDRFLAERFGRAGRRRVEEHFSVARMVSETQSLYLDLLRRSRWGRSRGVA
jgi:glycosyltransferase involved in cell wall biosynthesis